MQVHQAQPNVWISYAITAVVVGLVLFFRVRRMSKMQPLKLERLWVVPAIYLLVVIALFVQYPPNPSGWSMAGVGLIVGAALGWQRGKTMRIHIDPETHALNQKASIAGIAFILVLIVVKMSARAASDALKIDVGMLTDTLAALALGMFTVQRLEMYLRAKRMLAEARVGKA